MSKDRYLVRREEIDSMAGVQKTHFLNDNAKRLNKSLGDLTGLTGLGVHIIEVLPGHATTEHHKHYYEDECVYILSGEATAHIGDEMVEIKAGDFIGYRKCGLSHSIVNSGQNVLRCIVVGERSNHDVGDYPRQNKRIFRNSDLEWNLVELSDLEGIDNGYSQK